MHLFKVALYFTEMKQKIQNLKDNHEKMGRVGKRWNAKGRAGQDRVQKEEEQKEEKGIKGKGREEIAMD